MKQCEHKRTYSSGKTTWVNKGFRKLKKKVFGSKLIMTGHEKHRDVYADEEGTPYEYTGSSKKEFNEFLRNPKKVSEPTFITYPTGESETLQEYHKNKRKSYGAQPEKLIKTKDGEEWLALDSVNGFVKTGGLFHNLKPATPELLLKGDVERNAIGGPVIYNEQGQLIESMHVDYLDEKPFELSFKGKTIATKVKELK